MRRRTGFAPKGMSPEEVAQIAKNKLPNADVQIDGDTVRIYGATEQEWVTVTNTHRQEFDGGGMRDVETGKPRFDLLCPERVPYEHQYLTRVAKLMGRGAEHYTQYGDCTCGADTITDPSMHSIPVDLVTSASCGSEIPTTRSGNERTRDSGSQIPTTDDENSTETSSDSVHAGRGRTERSGSPAKSTTDTLRNLAASVGLSQPRSTTTIGVVNEDAGSVSAADFVTGATSVSGTTRGGSGSTDLRHSTGCPATKVVSSGARNWEQFADDAAYQRARSSAFRHFMQWFNGETDEDHAASVFFNVQAAEYVAGRMRGDW